MVNFVESSMRCRECIFFCFEVKCTVSDLYVHLIHLVVRSSITLFRFCLNDMSIGENDVLKSSNIVCQGQYVISASQCFCLFGWLFYKHEYSFDLKNICQKLLGHLDGFCIFFFDYYVVSFCLISPS